MRDIADKIMTLRWAHIVSRDQPISLQSFFQKQKPMSKKLEITETAALQAYAEADNEGKKLLRNLFKGQLAVGKITERINTLDDLMEAGTTKDRQKIRAYLFETDPHERADLADGIIPIISRVLNEEWVPNWDNSNESKYYPYFEMRLGSGFSYVNSNCAYASSYVGSRRVFQSAEIAMHAGTKFLAVYKDAFSPVK